MTEIRERRAGDLDECVRLLRQVHEADGYPLNWPADPRAWLHPPRILGAWVAPADGLLAGHALVTADGELSRLFVSPRRRGQGLARALIDAARATTPDGRLTLEVANDAAAAYYERTGWALTGSYRAGWTGPDGGPVTLRRYASVA
ncbi:GNAT family N-acetyltransferase [Actinoplanes sp. NPDC049599]|uniref:GNAT family N-acetyltransferase n=1 Tax=Actinoplanes sp. NPDC049599 TaxID=3363903 RepID=UPI0037B2CE9D